MRINLHQNFQPSWLIISAIWLIGETIKDTLFGWVEDMFGLDHQFAQHLIIYGWEYGFPLLLFSTGIFLLLKPKTVEDKIDTQTKVAIESSDNNSEFKLVESFPEDGQAITFEDLSRMYVKFSNPIDKSTQGYISNFDVRGNGRCQWTVGGWIKFSDDGRKLMWQPKEHYLSGEKNRTFKVIGPDYHSFEIHIGYRELGQEGRISDIYGNTLPPTTIRVFMK
jgi:hypothetical protein